MAEIEKTSVDNKSESPSVVEGENPPKGRKSSGRKSSGKQRRANGVATRQRILDISRGMFSTGGFEATSLRQIAAAASIDIATLKYHVGDKITLFGEVYRLGHEEMLRYLKPCMDSLKQVETRDALRIAIEDLVIALHDFISTEFSFVRMLLFRLLEGAEVTVTLEDALQGVAAEMFDDIFDQLRARSLTRDVDQRAVLNLLISSFTTWFVIAEVKPSWIQDPSPLHKEGRYRSEAFFVDLLERLILD